MRNLRTLLTAQALRVISLGTLCMIGAFATGMGTAGNVDPFSHSEAALQEIVHGLDPGRGDVNGNGRLDAEDSYLLYEFSDGLETPTPLQISRGDTDGDGRLTQRDLGFVLRMLSRK